MSTLVDTAITASYQNGYIIVQMESGVEIRFPVGKNKRLAHGTNEQLNNIEVSPYGLHWPELDEDLSFRGLLEGDYGQYLGNQISRCA
ncbi:MAG: DUF2442 domain-containing protein [bacterium]